MSLTGGPVAAPSVEAITVPVYAAGTTPGWATFVTLDVDAAAVAGAP